MDECAACAGRGRIDSIGYCSTRWDEVAPNLFVGGHDCTPDAPGAHSPDNWSGLVVVEDEFDVVVSLYAREGHGPAPGVEHLHHRMPDAALAGRDAQVVLDLARTVAERLDQGKKVLVRCQAGLNRSSLVAALALVASGWSPDEAIFAIRDARSPLALFNHDFVRFIQTQRPGALALPSRF